jgi:hypothetical protein
MLEPRRLYSPRAGQEPVHTVLADRPIHLEEGRTPLLLQVKRRMGRNP